MLRWWARWLPTAKNAGPEVAELVEVGPVADDVLADVEPAGAEPLSVRATRVD